MDGIITTGLIATNIILLLSIRSLYHKIYILTTKLNKIVNDKADNQCDKSTECLDADFGEIPELSFIFAGQSLNEL